MFLMCEQPLCRWAARSGSRVHCLFACVWLRRLVLYGVVVALTNEAPMKIVDVRLTGLSGGTVEGGWVDDLKPEEDINTIVEVITDEGLIGVGSAMTCKALVAAAVKLLRPMLIGERADEPMRVSEKLRQTFFWQGRGGAVEHAISGIDIALWDLM